MNFIDSVGNKFLSSLFPEGINEHVLLGQLCLDFTDRLRMHIHVAQRPAREVDKWGLWGKNYNVIVIELIGQSIEKIEVHNWQNIDFCQLCFSYKEGIYDLEFKGDSWWVSLAFKALIFQRCNVYEMSS